MSEYEHWHAHVSYYWDMKPHSEDAVIECLESDMGYLETYQQCCLA